jgi:peptide/nickel transport system permease protein
MSRWKYFLQRLVLAVPVIFLVITFLFIALRLGPVSPVAARLGPEASAADVQAVRESLGLNEPLWEQYTRFASDLLRFEGQSWVVQADRSIRGVLADTAPPTIWLGFWAILLPLFIGLPLGLYAGLNPNTGRDYVSSALGIVWLAMPNFWLASLLAAFLASTQTGGPLGFTWHTLGPDISSVQGTPSLNFATMSSVGFLPVPTGLDLGALAEDTKQILPPALVLGSASMAAEQRIGRTAVLENINSKYVETAKAKGVKTRTIITKHVFRNTLIPLIPVISNEAFLLIGGSVIIEEIFTINGLGRTFFQALVQGDLPLAGSLLFIFTLFLIFLNILQDLLYTIVDPRVGYER